MDLAYTAVAICLPFIIRREPYGGGSISWIGSILAILSHGFLHKEISGSNCDPTDIPNGTLRFGGFAFFLSLFTVSAYGDLGKIGISNNVAVANIVIALAAALITVYLSSPNGPTSSDKGIAPIFLITQLLVSFTAYVIPKEGKMSPYTGYAFILPCVVGIIELVFCCDGNSNPSWFNTYGGHVWYDIFLHLSIVINLIPPDYFTGTN